MHAAPIPPFAPPPSRAVAPTVLVQPTGPTSRRSARNCKSGAATWRRFGPCLLSEQTGERSPRDTCLCNIYGLQLQNSTRNTRALLYTTVWQLHYPHSYHDMCPWDTMQVGVEWLRERGVPAAGVALRRRISRTHAQHTAVVIGLPHPRGPYPGLERPWGVWSGKTTGKRAHAKLHDSMLDVLYIG